jgi:pyrimidine-nucleoside phosphorylase
MLALFLHVHHLKAIHPSTDLDWLLFMRAVEILRKKRDDLTLDGAEIESFIHGVTSGNWPDYQASALLMAIVLRGMNAEETAHLTRAMVRSGAKLDWSDLPGPKVGKHSTGGVGDKTSLIVAPLAAACGVIMPMISGRGLGHTGGTLDKLQAIPGFRVDLTLAEFRTLVQKVGCAIVGQTAEIAPADKILYGLRDVTATIESIPLITASIMSKKIAEGIDALVMDVKCGQGAFMKTPTNARALAESLVATGRGNGVRTQALITAMDVPLGRAVGNALEVLESIDTLRGCGPTDLETLAVALAARMVLLGGAAASLDEAETKVRAALSSGSGLEKLRQVIAHQGGDPRAIDDRGRLPRAPHQLLVRAERPGYVIDIHAELVGRASMALGAGRDRIEDAVNPGVGVVVQARPGELVKAGEALAEVHYRTQARLGEAMMLLRKAWRIGDAEPADLPLILESVS